ncbi:MAG: GumC family protein [Planctomycetota bacterium]|jgi:capsular exopolysaccharide synthesis family protein
MTGQIQPTNAMVRRPGPRPSAASAAPTLTPKQIVGILRRHIWLMIISTTLGVFFGGAAWYLCRRFIPTYTAQTAIEVLPPGTTDPMEIATGSVNKDLAYQLRFTKAAFIKQQSTFEKLLRIDKVRETAWFKQFNNDIPKAVECLEDDLGASPQREGNWIMLSMRCHDKKESALIVNEMLNLFLQEQRNIATRGVTEQLAARTEQQRRLWGELQQAEDTLETIRKGTEFTNLGGAAFRDYLDIKLSGLETMNTNLQSQEAQLQSFITTLRVRSEGEFDAIVREQIERDPIASGMRRTISSIELGLAQQLTRLGENHRQVRQMRDSLKQAKTELGNRQKEIADIRRKANLRNAEDQLTSLTEQLAAIQRQVIEAKREHKDMDNLRASYEEYAIIRDEKQKLLTEIDTYIEKLHSLMRDPEISKVRMVGLAPEPLRMSFPQKKIFLPGGFLLGLMVGVGLAFAIELLNDLLRTPSDVMKHLRVSLLGMICHADEDDEVEGVDLCHVVRQAPYSIMSECYRQFRTNLRLTGSGQSHKTLFVTSGRAGDGKTSVAVNLSATLVAEEKKVLFIDTNFRRPSTMTMFPRTEDDGSVAEHVDFGLSNYLMGQCEYDEVTRTSGIEGLDIIDSGPLPSNPAEILSSVMMTDLLDKSRQLYDYVIIDGPPLLISDAKIIAAAVDGAVVVFNAEATRRGTAQRTLRELRDINANLIGGVLVGVRSMKGGYFQEVYRCYQAYQQIQVAQPV